jgi:hypothetical protein
MRDSEQGFPLIDSHSLGQDVHMLYDSMGVEQNLTVDALGKIIKKDIYDSYGF